MADDYLADAESNVDQARGFIEKIENDRDRVLENIAHETRAKINRIYAQAHQSAREFHQLNAERTRARCISEADRLSARALARLRRESWRALRLLQNTAITRAQTRLDEMCRNPDRQWAWCRYWLREARNAAGDQALDITLGHGLKLEVKTRLEASLADYAGSWTLNNDETMGHGITIAWGHQLLDGRLGAQLPYLADEVFKRLANELHIEQERTAD